MHYGLGFRVGAEPKPFTDDQVSMQTWDSNEEAHNQALGVFWGCSVKAYIITDITP